MRPGLLRQDRHLAPRDLLLDGLQPNNRPGNLRRVDLYARVLKELQSQNELSEIQINEVDEVSIVLSEGPPLIRLGVGDFHSRWIRYLQQRSKIQEYPEAVEVDLRFKDQAILKMRTDETDEETVIWDAEKKSL